MIRKLVRHGVIVGLSALVAQAAFAVSTNPMDIDLSDDAPISGLPISPRIDALDPAPAAVAAEPVAEAPRAPPPPREPERPDLELVGTIASGDEGFGIFLDQSTKTPLRLKVGEDYQGWKLRSVRGREATLIRDQQAVVMTLPQPDGTGEGEVHLMPVSAVR